MKSAIRLGSGGSQIKGKQLETQNRGRGGEIIWAVSVRCRDESTIMPLMTVRSVWKKNKKLRATPPPPFLPPPLPFSSPKIMTENNRDKQTQNKCPPSPPLPLPVSLKSTTENNKHKKAYHQKKTKEQHNKDKPRSC